MNRVRSRGSKIRILSGAARFWFRGRDGSSATSGFGKDRHRTGFETAIAKNYLRDAFSSQFPLGMTMSLARWTALRTSISHVSVTPTFLRTIQLGLFRFTGSRSHVCRDSITPETRDLRRDNEQDPLSIAALGLYFGARAASRTNDQDPCGDGPAFTRDSIRRHSRDS